MKHIVLIGDSIFDNAAYVKGGPDVIAHLRRQITADDMSGYGYTLQGRTYNRIKIAVARNFDMQTGEWIDPIGIE